jgi:hypothetical protein
MQKWNYQVKIQVAALCLLFVSFETESQSASTKNELNQKSTPTLREAGRALKNVTPKQVVLFQWSDVNWESTVVNMKWIL